MPRIHFNAFTSGTGAVSAAETEPPSLPHVGSAAPTPQLIGTSGDWQSPGGQAPQGVGGSRVHRSGSSRRTAYAPTRNACVAGWTSPRPIALCHRLRVE